MLKQDMSSGKVLLSFETSPRNKSRYDTLAVNTEEPESEEAKEYASFLRGQERKCGPDGFLDSNKYTHSFQVRGKVLESKGTRPRKDAESLPVAKSAPPSLSPQKPMGEWVAPGAKKSETVVDVMNKIAKDEKEHTRRMKIVEDHMWQHRQEERDLKRAEGDLIKNQQLLKRTMRDYEIAINRKRQSEDQKMVDNKQTEFQITRNHMHRKEDMTKNRIEKAVSKQQQIKDEDRKVFLTIGDLERKYRAKVDEIELRRTEVLKLSDEFSKKMLLKEEETFRLNKELADLALTINMEVKKKQTVSKDTTQDSLAEANDKWKYENEMERKFEQKIQQNTGKGNLFENNKRKLTLEVSLARTGMEEKIRDEGRALLDTRNRLDNNSFTQRKLQEEALNTKLDLTNKRIERKLQLHNARKQKRLQHITLNKKEQHENSVVKWEERYAKRYYDASRRENEDAMKHAQKTVTKLEEMEHSLSNRVRESELSRKQREQQVRRLGQKLADMKRTHQQRIKEQMIECTNKERDMEQRLLREQSELAKVHVNREEGYLTLQKHRMSMQEDVNILSETAREHQRLMRIGQRTDLMTSFP